MNQTRIEQIKDYLKRLNEGESLDSVRKDFVNNFSDVEAMEIMQAEQQLIQEGIALEEIQKLCDVHSALFHDKTKEPTPVVNNPDNIPDKKALAEELEKQEGHLLNILHLENQALEDLLEQIKDAQQNKKDISELLKQIQPVVTHYAKKGDLLYPHLKVEYGVTGPSNVMWTVDDEIRDELNSLIKETDHNDEWDKRISDVLKRIEEMIYKEENILFPACALTFSEKDWKQLSKDILDYDTCFNIEPKPYKLENLENEETLISNEISLPGGSLSQKELQAIMKTLPLEITFIDENNLNKYFNEGEKVFKRPSIALGHDVFSCHPPKVEKIVRSIINDFKEGKRDQIPIWMEKKGKPFLVTYMAVRDEDGKYIGTMELVQDMQDIKKHFEK